ATWSASASALWYLPPYVPSVPTNSVSQKRHTADARSLSWPDQRLQPLNRQNTAALPGLAPSPCSVWKISLTEYVMGRRSYRCWAASYLPGAASATRQGTNQSTRIATPYATANAAQNATSPRVRVFGIPIPSR